MLYNKDLKKVQTMTDCLQCSHWDSYFKRCNGVGKTCFEYDAVTHTALDPVTKLPIKLD